MIDALGVHPSVEIMAPPAVMQSELADVDATVTVASGDALARCDAVVTVDHDEAFLTSDLEWIHSMQAGVDRLPLADLEAEGIPVTNSVGVHGDAAGETVAGYMLSFARQLHTFRSHQERGEWADPDWDDGFPLTGTSLCVVGLGTIGKGIAAKADALGVDVTAVTRTPTPTPHVRHVYGRNELHEAISDARFVALSVPLTEQTRRLVGPEELAAMREDAYLINVARGGVVDQDALVDALRREELSGAALDVFEAEPLPEESPLWDFEDVVVTPHEATDDRAKPGHIARLVAENVRRQNAGEELANRLV